MDDLGREFFDIRAAHREHSAVSAETHRRIDEVIEAAVDAANSIGVRGAPGDVVAKLIVEDLSAEQLQEIVTDWLEGRVRGA
jgi:hypothetical protein